MEKEVPVTYVTGIATYGFLNGIVNVLLTTPRWMPRHTINDDGNADVQIATEIIPTVDLRMDLLLVQQLHAALGAMIEEHTKRKVSN